MDDSSSSTGSVGGGEEDIDLNLGLDGDDDDDANDATNSDAKESSPPLGEVGASASVGSGVENPQLKLAGLVTFQNKSGITYKGRVVAIDPRPFPGSPRGVVRVKYDDWPYDKYDEDVSTEMVTPFGWVPTPVGRAGRRASKPPPTFTPSTDGNRHFSVTTTVLWLSPPFRFCSGLLEDITLGFSRGVQRG
ncbi:hypothetical protein Esi_0268_0022 [Ectocarpus siliculosus]|uniref:Uncharacterized protein n=1 Tax=Ectocarpus siliculosus TaxID=2880 RepID=D7FU82_ECTSI|nr:hypothetical protein Esi_0268_0022 [Ectocarpus siliculosus]|eukprot:CBJ31609.1 hypothetical protein Esi_0268_0022 [Ectocarpus siliculosus]